MSQQSRSVIAPSGDGKEAETIFDYPANWPDYIPELARHAYDEWRALFDSRGENYEDVLDSYRERANIDSLPLLSSRFTTVNLLALRR